MNVIPKRAETAPWDRPSIPRGGFRRAAGVTGESGRRSGSGIWFGVSFPFGSRVAVEVKVALTRRNSTDAVTMYRSTGKSVTAKLNSAHPRPSHCPRRGIVRQGRETTSDVSEGKDADSIARANYPLRL